MRATLQQLYLRIIVLDMQKGSDWTILKLNLKKSIFKLVSILSRFWTLYGIFAMIATLQQFYLCIIVLNMQKGSDCAA